MTVFIAFSRYPASALGMRLASWSSSLLENLNWKYLRVDKKICKNKQKIGKIKPQTPQKKSVSTKWVELVLNWMGNAATINKSVFFLSNIIKLIDYLKVVDG